MNGFNISRKTFLGGFGAAFGSAVLPAQAFVQAGGPIMRFGVASDVHINLGWKDDDRTGLRGQPYFLEKALRWFDENKADAVVFSGDMAHLGRMEELTKLVEVWDKVFPGMKRSDGEKVERMAVTGNHEIGQWPGLWDRYTDEQLRKIRFDYDQEHMNANWRKLFGEDYQLIWKRFTASRMAGAVYDTALAKIAAGSFLFTASASRVRFAGFLDVCMSEEDREEGEKTRRA